MTEDGAGGPAAEWLAVGRITHAHGVRGEVSVLPLSPVESRFERGSLLRTGKDAARTLTVASSRPHRQRLLVTFEEVGDRGSAEGLRGEYLFVPAWAAPPLPQWEYWPHQLVGCEVLFEDGRLLGRIREIMRTPANDVWAVEGPGGEALIPALRDVVESVDIPGRRVVVRAVAGLTAP
jgi:16S rRNA processing protein RimM